MFTIYMGKGYEPRIFFLLKMFSSGDIDVLPGPGPHNSLSVVYAVSGRYQHVAIR